MTAHYLKIQLAQLNFTVGDLTGNCQKILDSHQKAQRENADLIVFSELAITGYPPEDLLNKDHFLFEIEEKIEQIKLATKNSKTAILLGAPILEKSAQLKSRSDRFTNRKLYNCALLIDEGEIVAKASKTCLPNFGIFDEHRYFTAAPTLNITEFRGFRLAILICEDLWHQRNSFLLGDRIFDAIICINASPFATNKPLQRLEIAQKFIKNLKKPLIYLNQIGGQDSLVFDGGSFVLNENGEEILVMKEFAEDSNFVTLNENSCHTEQTEGSLVKSNDKLARMYNATILGLRDYIHKNGFTKILLGMSGGIDSALVATIAVDAFGPENVKLIALPSKYNSSESMDDALKAAENLGVKLEIINIENSVLALNEALEAQFKGLKTDSTEENIQSRIRGNILMALSNKLGNLLLSTGNKSELAVGYATIYGDMCGSFNPIKDLYKTEVFSISEWRNANIPTISIYQKTDLIPANIISKEPTAELRDNQKDSDSLPEYEILDQILYQLIEKDNSVENIVEMGFEESLVKKVSQLFLHSEYKRKQSVIGPKISEMSFDLERRYPITNKFKQ
jgi:NAD+ synthase